MTSVAAHLRMTGDALRRDPEPGERRWLLRNQAQVALLAGRLAADDLGNLLSGRAYYGQACDSAREAGDAHFTAVAHGYAAGLAAAEGMTAAALDHLTLAAEHAHASPALASWLASIEATIHADRGELDAAREALDRAQVASSARRAGPGSSNECAAATLAAVTGHVLLRDGYYGGAREALTAALDQLSPA
ncbi:MAG: hypothetical protein LC799_29985, partial [Actinobacteria bacterium]|nr:hypothetical protein [Actinomycetota bacterium]